MGLVNFVFHTTQIVYDDDDDDVDDGDDCVATGTTNILIR
jgi:hypothetical protein